MKKRKNDIILIAAVLLLVAALWLGISLLKSEGGYVLVTVDGEQKLQLPLSEAAETEIDTGGGHYNRLLVKNGAASVIDADCPDKLCVGMGEIRYGGQSIICLPHKLVAEIVGGRDGGEDVIVR